jgi:hypothetical protein
MHSKGYLATRGRKKKNVINKRILRRNSVVVSHLCMSVFDPFRCQYLECPTGRMMTLQWLTVLKSKLLAGLNHFAQSENRMNATLLNSPFNLLHDWPFNPNFPVLTRQQHYCAHAQDTRPLHLRTNPHSRNHGCDSHDAWTPSTFSSSLGQSAVEIAVRDTSYIQSLLSRHNLYLVTLF